MANHSAPDSAATPAGSAAPQARRERHWLRIGAVLVIVAAIAGGLGWAAAGGAFDSTAVLPSTGLPGSPGTSEGPIETAIPTPAPTPTPRPPLGGTELLGYLPYWQMNDQMASYLAKVPVSTLALYSVAANKDGGIRHAENGYRRITGDIGRRLIADAHARRQRVELVFTSFGSTLNTRLFADDPEAEARRARAARELLALVDDLGVDGINVDVERVDGDISVGYASFISGLRAGLTKAHPHATLSVATPASHTGTILAGAAVTSGADRIFLMGYDYHWSGSAPGASAPIDNRTGDLDLMASIVDYVEFGVPRDQILLGLPLYGMSWPVAGPERTAEALGSGTVWIPSKHTKTLLAADFSPAFDDFEIASYFIVPDGAAWRATYYDSPTSLRPKLELARSQGLVGAGFWAIGYESGLPGYLDLMRDFRAGRIGG